MSTIIETDIFLRTMTDIKYVDTGEFAMMSIVNGQWSQAKRILTNNQDQLDEFIQAAKKVGGSYETTALNLLVNLVEEGVFNAGEIKDLIVTG